jgi:hypothetical protein
LDADPGETQVARNSTKTSLFGKPELVRANPSLPLLLGACEPPDREEAGFSNPIVGPPFEEGAKIMVFVRVPSALP